MTGSSSHRESPWKPDLLLCFFFSEPSCAAWKMELVSQHGKMGNPETWVLSVAMSQPH